MIRMQTSMTVALALVLCGGAALAQTPPEQPGFVQPAFAPPAPPPAISLQVQVVLSRHQGDKKISSLPYMLSVNTGSRASQLRMGARVPIATQMGAVSSFNYEEVGISIDCAAVALDDGRFKLTVGIDDSAPYEPAKDVEAGQPASFRSFKSNQSVVLKHGQSTQLTMATDKVTGEVVRAEVSLTVVK